MTMPCTMPRGAQEAAEGQNTSKKTHLFLSKKSPKNVCLARVCVGRPGMLSEENRSLCGLGCSAEIETLKPLHQLTNIYCVYVAWDAQQRLKPSSPPSNSKGRMVYVAWDAQQRLKRCKHSGELSSTPSVYVAWDAQQRLKRCKHSGELSSTPSVYVA